MCIGGLRITDYKDKLIRDKIMKYKKFEDLPIWQDSIELAGTIYAVTNLGEWAKDFGLRDQIRRAVVSISSNIAEGFEKNNNNEFLRYLKIAKGSTGEVRSQLYVARKIAYLAPEAFEPIHSQSEKLCSNIGGFISYLEDYRNSQH